MTKTWMSRALVPLAALIMVGIGVTTAEAATITTTVAATMNVRSGPTTKSAIVGSIPNGDQVTFVCKVTGELISGRVRTTDQWDRLSDGRYVTDSYVRGATTTLSTCPTPAGPNGTMTAVQFVAAAVAPAQQGQREFRVPASVTIAQAILESGWGKSGLTSNDRNFFGIKCFNGVTGPIANGCHTYATAECEPVCLPTTASFRTYASATDSFRDHGRFLTTNSRYRPAFAYTTDANRFIYEVWKAGYATSPTYATTVIALMTRYNLYQYDLR